MLGTGLLGTIAGLLVGAGAAEVVAHRRNLRKIPVRVHVNGTRGKSSVTRLVAAALRKAGTVTCAKTTGTLARFIEPDGRELPIFRPSGANVIEQKRMVALAAAHEAQALVIECMALTPELQALCEIKLIQATHAVVTNARPDHLEVMGPSDRDVAAALASMTPIRGKLYTAEQKQLAVFEAAAKDRGSELVVIGPDEIAEVSEEELAAFRYTEHADNVALALRLVQDLGVERELALAGMQACRPDPGALREYELDFFGRRIVFVNGFAANDPVSSRQLYDEARARHADILTTILIVNCRAERAERSIQLGSELPSWTPPHHVLAIGTGTYLFARAVMKSGLDPSRLDLAEDLGEEDIFEKVLSLVGKSALVIGMGNIGGQGFALARYFANRSRVGDAAA